MNLKHWFKMAWKKFCKLFCHAFGHAWNQLSAHAEQCARCGATRSLEPSVPVEPPKPPEPPVPPEPPKPPALPPLTVDGILFRAGSDLWRWKGVTAFALYRNYLQRGPDAVIPFLDWAKQTGFNLVRVFGQFTMCQEDRSRWLDPRQVGERWWTEIDPFLTLCNDHGLYVEWVALCDQQAGDLRLNVSVEERRAHLARLAPILAAHSNVVGEVMNEPPFNGGLDGLDAFRANGLLVASGSYDYGDLRARDFVTVHSDRDAEWPRKIKDPMREIGVTGYGSMAAVRKPVVADEPIGAAEYDAGGKRSTNAADFRDYARVCALFGPGGTYHFEAGMQGEIPAPGSAQQRCAEAFVEGLNGPPLDVATGFYTAGHLSETPIPMVNELRVFSMIQGGRATSVVVRKGYAGTPPTRDGWRIVKQSEDGGLVELER